MQAHRCFMTFFRLCATVVFVFTATLTATAKMIVDWGGDYVTGSRNMVLPSGIDNGGTRTFPYSASVQITPNSDYSVPAGKTGPIYGASELTSSDGTPRSFGAARVSNSDTNDWIYFQGISQVAGSLQGLTFFIQSDFLNGFNAGSLSLSNLKGHLNVTALNASGSVRMAVRDGNNAWFVSQAVRTSAGVFDIASLADQSWGSWDPTGAPLAALPSTFDTPGSSITGVTAFGYYFTASRTSAPSINVRAFQIEFDSAKGTFIKVQ